MAQSIPFNPLVTTSFSGGFVDASTDGLVQGTAYPDPATRYALRQGFVAPTETYPMYGGIACYANIPGAAGGPVEALGYPLGRATSVTGGSYPIAGWTVTDQAYNMINSPQSPAPLALEYDQINWYALGSRARIAVACDPSLVDLFGQPLSSQVAWDFVNQQLIPYTGSETISSGTYTSGTGVVVLTMASASNVGAGDTVTLSALTGSGAYASLDGTWQVTAVSANGLTVTLQTTSGLGAAAITGGTLSTGAALTGVSVLEVNDNQSVIINYNTTTGAATYASGCCAILRI